MKVFIPEYKDLMEMVMLGEEMWRESVFSVTEEYDIPGTLEYGVEALAEHKAGKGSYIRGVREEEGGPIIGMVIGYTTPYFFCTKKKMAVDSLVYVRQDKRGTSAAYRLLKDFEDWARDQGAIEMSIGVSTGIHPEKTHDFYVKMGYNHTGGIYKKPLQNQE